MKKIYNTPEVVELSFRDTAFSCGEESRRIVGTSGPRLTFASDCYSMKSWFGGRFGGVFDEEPEEIVEKED